MQGSADTSRDLNTALRNTLAIVMAGGRGSRLKQLTDIRSKPAVPFGGKFRIIDFPLSNCLNSGIRKVGVLTQYKAHSLIQHVQNGWGFLRGELNEFVQVWPAQQQTPSGDWYRGTADAVFQNLQTLLSLKPEYILILAGDHVYRQDYSRMLAEHIESGADATVSCVDVPIKQANRLRCGRRRRERRHRQLPGKAGKPAGHPRRAGPRLRQHGHLHLQRRFS